MITIQLASENVSALFPKDDFLSVDGAHADSVVLLCGWVDDRDSRKCPACLNIDSPLLEIHISAPYLFSCYLFRQGFKFTLSWATTESTMVS